MKFSLSVILLSLAAIVFAIILSRDIIKENLERLERNNPSIRLKEVEYNEPAPRMIEKIEPLIYEGKG